MFLLTFNKLRCGVQTTLASNSKFKLEVVTSQTKLKTHKSQTPTNMPLLVPWQSQQTPIITSSARQLKVTSDIIKDYFLL